MPLALSMASDVELRFPVIVVLQTTVHYYKVSLYDHLFQYPRQEVSDTTHFLEKCYRML